MWRPLEKPEPKRLADDGKPGRNMVQRPLAKDRGFPILGRQRVFKKVFRLAMHRLGVSRGVLEYRLGVAETTRGLAGQRSGALRFDRFMYCCKLAGIPRSYAAVLWARESIPDEYEDLKRFVGVTLSKRLSPANKMSDSDDAWAFLDDTGLRAGAKRLPDEPGQIVSGGLPGVPK